jgi:hypothetical protein
LYASKAEREGVAENYCPEHQKVKKKMIGDNSVGEIILYIFLSYLTLHLLLGDIIVFMRFFVVKEKKFLLYLDIRTIFTICLKLCDITMKCVMGYFVCFQTCWEVSCNSIKEVMIAYFQLLEKLFTAMLNKDIVVYLAVAAVAIVVCISVTIILVI